MNSEDSGNLSTTGTRETPVMSVCMGFMGYIIKECTGRWTMSNYSHMSEQTRYYHSNSLTVFNELLLQGYHAPFSGHDKVGGTSLSEYQNWGRIMCYLRFPAWDNCFPQMSHLCGISCVYQNVVFDIHIISNLSPHRCYIYVACHKCVSMCCFRCTIVAHCFPQM